MRHVLHVQNLYKIASKSKTQYQRYINATLDDADTTMESGFLVPQAVVAIWNGPLFVVTEICEYPILSVYPPDHMTTQF